MAYKLKNKTLSTKKKTNTLQCLSLRFSHFLEQLLQIPGGVEEEAGGSKKGDRKGGRNTGRRQEKGDGKAGRQEGRKGGKEEGRKGGKEEGRRRVSNVGGGYRENDREDRKGRKGEEAGWEEAT